MAQKIATHKLILRVANELHWFIKWNYVLGIFNCLQIFRKINFKLNTLLPNQIDSSHLIDFWWVSWAIIFCEIVSSWEDYVHEDHETTQDTGYKQSGARGGVELSKK